MKNKQTSISRIVAVALLALGSAPTWGQAVVPKDTLPMVLVPHIQKINYMERFLSYEIPASVPFDVTTNVDWIQHRVDKNNNHIFHVDRYWGDYDRSAEITFSNRNKGIREVLQLTQGFDPNINERDYQMLMDKINAGFTDVYSDEDVEKIIATYHPSDNGSFTGIDYASTSRAFPASKHMSNLRTLAFSYADPNNGYYQDEKVYNIITKGLDFWIKRNPRSSNWWSNEIGMPQQIGTVLIRMRYAKKAVPSELEKRIFAHMERWCGYPGKGSGATGVNRTDVATHWLYRGILDQNEEVTRIGLDNIFYPVFYTTAEGFQHDHSYCQHGHQLYISGYGEVMANSLSRFFGYVAGTKFRVTDQKLDVLSQFLRNCYYRTIRGYNMHWDVLGRGLGRKGICNKGRNAIFAQNMLDIDAEHREEYEATIARVTGKQPADYKVEPFHNFFHRGEYTLHIRPEYSFSVRTASSRMHRNEWGDGGNLQGYFVNEGGTCIMRSGKEYENVSGVWNWTQMPGVTAPQMEAIPQDPSYMTKGFGNFAGGVSDSLYGASAFAYFNNYADNKYRHTPAVNTGAYKSWFFFDKEVVCLGSVTSTSDSPVNTTVNQCKLLKSDVYMNDGTSTTTVNVGTELKHIKPEWVWHNGIGYVFPQGGDIWLNNRVQTGDWFTSSSLNAHEEVSDSVFSLGFDYPMKPTEAPYAYIVVPTVDDKKAMEDYYQTQPIEIVKNEHLLQSVYHKGLKIWQTIFFTAGTITHDGMTIKANAGCAVMIKPTADGRYVMHISDPNYARKAINLTVEQTGKEAQTISAGFHTLPFERAGETLVYYFK